MTLSADPESRNPLPPARSAAERPDERAIRVVDIDAETASFLGDLAVPRTVMPTVAVVGMGYVGLPTSLALVGQGCRVIGVDIDARRLAAISEQRVDLIPDDRRRLAEAVDRPDFALTVDPAALSLADAVIICVPTPVDEDRNPDLRALRSATQAVVEHAVPGQVIVLTSTSHVGATRALIGAPLEARGFTIGQDVFVAFSPERIDPGNTAFPQQAVPRVIGGMTPECTRRVSQLIGGIAPVHTVGSPEVAELAKLYENTFRAVNIALANEVETVSEMLGVDPHEVIDAAATKPFGFMRFQPGIGVGGHCIPCDPHYLLSQLPDGRASAPLIEQAMAGIAARPGVIVDRAAARLAETGRALAGARVLVVGAAYKAGVEDVRESPALDMLELLRAAGARVGYVDRLVPTITLRDGTKLRSEPDPAAESYDVVIVHVIQDRADLEWLADVEHLIDPAGHLRRAPARLTLVEPLA